MNIFIRTLLILVSVFAGSFTILSCTKDSEHSEEQEVHADHKETYTCPMHPQILSDKPGSCPICGMDLVLVEPDGAEGASDSTEEAPSEPAISSRSQVKLAGEKRQMIGMATSPVKVRKLTKTINAPGRVAFDPDLYTAKSEYVEALRQGNRVKESPLEEVRRSTQEMIRSARIRLRVLGLSEEQIKKISTTGRASENLILGQRGSGAIIYADVFETELPYIESELPVVISGSSLAGKSLKGKVIAVDSVINSETRAARVRIEIEEGANLLRPESFVSVKIISPLGEHLSIPKEAVLNTGKEQIVFVEKEKGIYQPVRVNPTVEGDVFIAVQSELKEGQAVVTQGNFMLDSESRLRAVFQSARPGHEH